MTQTTVASYLTQRLKQAGLKHAFGVPGDYVLTFMDRLIESGIELVGTCNELNAGYAADAYARINGIGCVCVTWGVGGFSAMNAVAGAYAEQVPLVVLVGGPRTTQRGSSMLLHHSVGDFATMQQAYSHITAASVLLDDPAEAPQRIDRALARCMAEKRPIMIEIPADMVDQVVRNGVPGDLPHAGSRGAEGGGGAVQLLGGVGQGLLEPVVWCLGSLLAGAVARRGSAQEVGAERGAGAEPGHVQRRG